jgi:hypothetical protein
MFLGIKQIDEYIRIPAKVLNPSTGVLSQPTALTYSIYEEGNATGIDEAVDMVPASPFDGVTGVYLVARQLTAAAGFETGKSYQVWVTWSVNGVPMGEWHTFQILLPSAYDAAKTAAQAATALSNATWTDARAGYLDAAVSTRSSHNAAAVKTAVEAAGSSLAQILEDTGTTLPATLTTIDGKADVIQERTDNLPDDPAAKGDKMDLIDAPNATAVTAFQDGVATASDLAAAKLVVNAIKTVTDGLTEGDVSAILGTTVSGTNRTVAECLAFLVGSAF